MRILLTGACGLVGRAILRRGGGDGHQFVPLDVSPDVERLTHGVRASVADRDAVLHAADGCDAIIHTAAMHGGFKDKASNQEFIATNVIGAENLFEAAVKHGIRRLVMSSTLEILCGADWLASGRVVLDESMSPRPDWIYPLTKLTVEQLGRLHAEQDKLEVVHLRYAWVIDEETASHGVDLLARGVADTDVADANLLAATKEGLRGNHVLLIGPDVPFTQCDIELAQKDPSEVLERHWPGSASFFKERKARPKPSHFWPVCRIDRAIQLLGWRPLVTFERFLRNLGWYPGAEQPKIRAFVHANAGTRFRPSEGQARNP